MRARRLKNRRVCVMVEVEQRKGGRIMPKKALIAMSGGVDSSVAAACMTEAGYDCLGVTMRLHDYGATCGAAAEDNAFRSHNQSP